MSDPLCFCQPSLLRSPPSTEMGRSLLKLGNLYLFVKAGAYAKAVVVAWCRDIGIGAVRNWGR